MILSLLYDFPTTTEVNDFFKAYVTFPKLKIFNSNNYLLPLSVWLMQNNIQAFTQTFKIEF